MRRRRLVTLRGFRTTSLLFLALVVALGTLAVGYGLWSKNLVINGHVHTGDLNADWDGIVTSDPTLPTGNPDPCTPTLNPTGCPSPRKDVGSCDATIGDEVYGDQVATVFIRNAYPSYECSLRALISNHGTIPFNVIGASLNIGPPLELLGPCGPLPGQDPQVDPGQEFPLICTVHVRQEAEQNWDYSFHIKVCVAQWNENATYEECVNSPQHEGPP